MAKKSWIDIKSIQFQTILENIRNYVSQLIGGTTDISQSSVFGQLLTVISNVTHNILTYIEDAFTEQNKYSCSRKKSVFGLAAQSGYQPSLGCASKVWVRISPKPNNGTGIDLIVLNHTKFLCTQNGLYYSLILPTASVTLKTGGDTLANKYFYLVQGQFETQRYVSNGGPLQAINVSYTGFIDTQYLSLKVNGEEWVQVASLYDMSPNSNEYCLMYNPTGGVDVLFGDGRYGRILSSEDVIDVTYLSHDGEGGNLNAGDDGNTYFVFNTPLKDICGGEQDGNMCFTISMFTSDSVASGSDAQSADEVKNLIGFNSRSLVLCDANSYKSELSKYSFVGYNKTWSEPGSLIIKSVVMKNYKTKIGEGSDYFSLTDDDFFLSDIQKTSIINAISSSGSQLAGTSYVINDMELKKYALFVYIRLKEQDSDQQTVENNIKNVVGQFFGDIENDDYIPMSDITHIIKEEIDEIDGVNCYVLSQENEEAKERGYYDKKTYIYDPSNGTFKTTIIRVPVFSGEDPGLGMDSHGNILLQNDDEFPVLMGGWQWRNVQGNSVSAQPITIVFE